MPAVTDVDEIDPISEYLDRVYRPIAMDERIRTAVSQLEEIGRPHNAAVQEVVAKLKNPDRARREVVQAARVVINHRKYQQYLKDTPWWRRDPEGWWIVGMTALSLVVNWLIPQPLNRDVTTNIAVALSCFIAAFGCSVICFRTRTPTKSAWYYSWSFLTFLVWGVLDTMHSNPKVREFLPAPMFLISGMSLGLGIIALRFEKSKRGLDTTLWNRKV